MKRWISLLTVAIFVVAFATPLVASENGKGSGGGGCSPSISSKTTTKTGTQNVIAAAASIAASTGTSQSGGTGGEAHSRADRSFEQMARERPRG